MLLVSDTLVDRCWSYVLITIMLFTYSLQLTILMIDFWFHPDVRLWNTACIFPDCGAFCATVVLQNHICWEGRMVVMIDSEKKKCTFLSCEAFFCKVGEVYISLCKDCESFSEILCTVWLSAYKKTHSSWNNCVCGGGVWAATAFKERESCFYEKRWKLGLFSLGEVSAC